MALDAITLHAVLEELRPQLIGSRIEKVQQPARDQIILLLRGNRRLLLHAGANAPRIQLTSYLRDNPSEPPMFCMLLRKHFSSARIAALRQPDLERLVEIELDVVDELGNQSKRILVLEAMGRRSNLILLDENNRIVESIRRVDADLSRERQILPGLFYRYPSRSEKILLPQATQGQLETLFAQAPPEMKLSQTLLNGFFGLSPMMARELAFESCGDVDALVWQGDSDKVWHSIQALQTMFTQGDFVPIMLLREDKPFDVSYRPLAQYGDYLTQQTFASFSDLLDGFYQTQEHQARIRQQGTDLVRTATNARDRLRKKRAMQEKEYATTLERDQLRIQGELITANLYRMHRGETTLVAENYYDPQCASITIPLDPLLTPQANAAKYYKRYTKAKTAQQHLEVQMELATQELVYLESVLEEIGRAETQQDFLDIRTELQDAGYLRRQGKEKKHLRRPSGPRVFQTSDGYRVLVGRNNRQNDQLTLKDADSRDIWLHTQKIHGSHVILCTKGVSVPPETIVEAAKVAAYFSQAKDSANVPVDYTPVKFVKKPAGGRPGMVIYTTYQTVNVRPEEDLVKAMSVK